MMKKTITHLLVLISLLSSCTAKLTREKAKEILIQSYSIEPAKPVKIAKEYQEWKGGTMIAPIGEPTTFGPYVGSPRDMTPILTLEKSKEIIIEKIYTEGVIRPRWYIYPTESSKKYLVNEDNYSYYFKPYNSSIQNVTGLSENDNETTVTFTIKNEFTPFNFDENVSQEESKSITLVRFDDGWRVKN